MFDKSEMDQVLLATGGYDHTIKLWHTHSGICYRTMQHSESQVNALEITPDKQLLAAASYQHIYMYDLNSNNPNAIVNYDGTTKNVTDVGFQIDGRWMYSGGEDCRVRLWDLKSKGTQCPKIFEVQAPVTCVCLHPNQVELFVGDQSGIIYRWDLKTDHNEQLIPESDAMILDIAIDPLGTHMAAVNNKGRCYIWSLKSGKIDEPTKMNPKHKFDAHKRHALKCEFSPDSRKFCRYLVTTSADQTAKIWNTGDFSLRQELKQENQRWVWDAAFSSDSQYVFTASSDCCAKIWNIETGVMEKEYAGHQKAVTALAFRDCAV
jgi:G protein beta subunit-like protein